jgi:CRISPR-associated endonuclease/helicase Cas3
MASTPYAHTLPNRPQCEWEPLFTPFGIGTDECQRENCEKCQRLEPYHGHLNKVAYWTARFASEMFAPESPPAKSAWNWGYRTGLWHDLGKFSQEFQNYLGNASVKTNPHGEDIVGTGGRVDHSSAGAQHSASDARLGPLMAYSIAGHHAGLPDGVELRERLLKKIATWEEYCPEESKTGLIPDPPLSNPTERTPPGAFRLAFHLRMMFSALVDADFLCTEAFMTPAATAQRYEWPDNVLERMEDVLQRHLDEYGTPQTVVDKERLHVRRACEAAAIQDLGFFDLTVPTGGGKTLSSLMFALRHARKYGLRRVICAIPFTSIIEQNAEVYRSVFKELALELGQEIVLEHHSNLQPDHETTRNRLAAENWDAPLIVTTNVQLFESLFACRTSVCRKLHRLAQSVIVLDEAQALPVRLLRPVLLAMRCLVHDFRSSIVLCTATQPALEKREGFDPGIPADIIRPIIKDRVRLYERLRRTRVEALGPQTNEDLMARVIAERGGSLVIVNTTKAARDFYSCLDLREMRRFHLSARMCPEHRSAVLADVRRLLAEKQPLTLVSTQLIEAGVDVSFPAVYRAQCGLDSLAQAAGRCNRNGEMKDASGAAVLGHVYTFEHTGYDIPKQLVDLRSASSDAAQITPRYMDDLLSLEAIEHFFRLHIWTVGQRTNQWDQPDVTGCFPPMAGKDWQFTIQFREAAKRFQMIPQVTHPLVIPWGEKGKALCKELRERDRIGLSPTRAHYRRAQRYTVQVYDWEWQRLTSENRVESLLDGALHLLIHPENDYDEAFGLRPPDSPDSPSAFMV